MTTQVWHKWRTPEEFIAALDPDNFCNLAAQVIDGDRLMITGLPQRNAVVLVSGDSLELTVPSSAERALEYRIAQLDQERNELVHQLMRLQHSRRKEKKA